jgi:CMP-N,N'-diacetyllegionaminic acid synthase
MRVLGLIPARGGSKGIPRKNVRPLAGKPLIQHTIDAARAAGRLTRVIVSTDDAEIADVARRGGAEVPFLRPGELARDDTPMLPVVQHALDTLEQAGELYDAVCLLQPSSPLRTGADIDACIAMLEQEEADAVVSVLPVPAEYNPHWVYFRRSDGTLRLATGETTPIPRRQALPPAFHRDGAVYVTRTAVVRHGSLYGERLLGYLMDPAWSVNLDERADWERAEALLGRRIAAPAAALAAHGAARREVH